MAKRKRLLDELATIEQRTYRTGVLSFHERLAAEKPALYEELVEVIVSHASGGVIANKLPTVRHLKHELDSRKLLPKCSESTFREWYNKLARQHGKA